jgi:hypothetical protein
MNQKDARFIHERRKKEEGIVFCVRKIKNIYLHLLGKAL